MVSLKEPFLTNRFYPAIAFAVFVCAASAGAGDAPVADVRLRTVVAWQLALERVGLSPGIIDGRAGPKTELATREFQRVRRLPVTGQLDEATRGMLGVDVDAAIVPYVIQASDFEEIEPVPRDWNERAKLSKLGYESVECAIAEKFHCSRGLLTALNPRRVLRDARAGDLIDVPNAAEPSRTIAAETLYLDLTQKVIRALNHERELVALFHCSIAADKAKRPRGEASVVTVAFDPDYMFDPRMWPEVKNVHRKLRIAPGPRNPVGRCWIGLNLPGYGIHGSPAPELIGKTGSHGCFRLTNWDAVRLGKMVRPGTKIRFFSQEGEQLAGK